MVVKIKLNRIDLEAKGGLEMGRGHFSELVASLFAVKCPGQRMTQVSPKPREGGKGPAKVPLNDEGLGVAYFQVQIPHHPGGGDSQMYKTWSLPSRSFQSCYKDQMNSKIIQEMRH